MGTWAGAFIENPRRADLGEVLASHHVALEGSADAEWIYVLAETSFASLEAPAFAERLSRELGGKVIAFFLQSTASVEEIFVYDAGERVRHLSYSMDEGGWLAHEGDVQDWEAAYFFEEGHGARDGERWPLNLDDEIGDDERAAYEAARETGDATPVLELLHVGSGWGLYRLAEHFGVRDGEPHAIYQPPGNRTFRWKTYAVVALVVLFFVGMFLLGALSGPA